MKRVQTIPHQSSILVVDDNHNNLRLLTGLLTEQGYNVRSVLDGRMALKSARKAPPDLVLLDIMMPGMDGYTVCSELKADQDTRDIPIIFISAMDEMFDKMHGFSVGGVDYITKPFQIEEVLARVATHLNLHIMQKQLQEQNEQLQQHIAERKKTEQALRESERRFRLLAENARDIIYRYRLVPPFGFEYVSPSVTTILGYPPEEYYADPDLHNRIIHPDSRDLFDIFQQDPATWQQPLMLRVFRKDGKPVWIEQHQWPVFDASGQVVAIEGITRDITERKRGETQLIQQQQALAMLRERERLARELHDSIGQVLGYMSVQAQAARDLLSRGDVPGVDTHLANLVTVAQESHGDIREFILGVRVGARANHDFFTSLHHYLKQFEQIYRIQTYLNVPPELRDQSLPPAVEAHLLRIIQEALTNVRKHASATLVHVLFSLVDEQMQIVVADNGQGFLVPSHVLVSEDECGQSYGLRSMHDRAREIGAVLLVESTPGAGTRVLIRVPRRVSDTTNVLALKVLLVDDHPLFLEGLRNMLVARGIAVVGTASNGYEALEQARRLHPDIILMDVEMPECDGLQATRLIKAELPDTQIVMLTVSTDDEYLFEAIKMGASGYLLKSLDSGDFFALLSGLEQGEAALSPDMAKKVLFEFAQQTSRQPVSSTKEKSVALAGSDAEEPESQQLTAIEAEILSLVSQGYTYRQVGERVGYSERSIKHYMSEIIKRLHLRNRADAVAYARKTGLSP